MSAEFIDCLKNGHEGKCPTCGRFAKVYYRSIHTSVALQLIQIYKLGGAEMYIHTSKLIPKGVSGAGDFSKAQYWELVKEMPHTPGKKKSSGYWMLTELGVEFVKGNVSVTKYALVYDTRVIDMKGKLVSITECIGNKFDYEDLMAGVA